MSFVHQPPSSPDKTRSNFTIDYILNSAGYKESEEALPWIHCTRYRPPKLQRCRKKEPGKRKLCRNPRIPFSGSQIAILEEKYNTSPYLNSTDLSMLASILHLSHSRVKIWFQNRRARERRENNTKGCLTPKDKDKRLVGEAGVVTDGPSDERFQSSFRPWEEGALHSEWALLTSGRYKEPADFNNPEDRSNHNLHRYFNKEIMSWLHSRIPSD